MNKKYIVRPGYVRSKYDGQRHYVGVSELIRLYKVRPYECIIDNHPFALMGIDVSKFKVLSPRRDGNYNLED